MPVLCCISLTSPRDAFQKPGKNASDFQNSFDSLLPIQKQLGGATVIRIAKVGHDYNVSGKKILRKKIEKMRTLNEVQDELIGKVGTVERDLFEYELQTDSIGRAIKKIRKERNLTQKELGELIGVQKAQISLLLSRNA